MSGIYIFETKTKSQIDQRKIERQMMRDLQSLFYVIALESSRVLKVQERGKWLHINGYNLGDGTTRIYPVADVAPIRGVRYNVIRRSAHKTPESMVKKITEDREEGRIGEWFSRWKVEISGKDVERFKRECLHPILENMCDDYEWWTAHLYGKKQTYDIHADVVRHKVFPWHIGRHYTLPYGCYNVISEGGFSEVDDYINTGSRVGLQEATTLFPELTKE